MKISTLFRVIFVTFCVVCVLGEEVEQQEKGSPVQFEANVKTMLDMLIGSLYTNRDIFLRELISNGSDALDKIRFLYLTKPKEPKADNGDAPTMDIRISSNKEDRTLVMRDGGIGMTKEEMGKNLGTLGTSGTKEFLEKLKESQGDEKLIGQFGVGFYSAFLVADKVRVASKSDDSDKQWVWESRADGSFFLYPDSRGNTLGRGTEITLELRKDADEYLDQDKLKEIVHHYSEFIHFPIYLQIEKKEKVPKKADDSAAEEKKSEEGDVEEKKDDEKKDEEMEEVTTYDWELINENKPIWTRPASEIKEDEYNKFYKALTKDHDDPMYYTHFSAEGEVQFKALLFIPGRAPYNVFDTSTLQANIRLYVRRVFITDEFKDLLPRYLNFIKGVVDSDDLPLHVSRELLQENRILKIIKRKLVRKALGMLQEIADNDKKIEEKKSGDKKDDAESDEDKKDDDDSEDEDKETGGKKQKDILFPKFWDEFGKNMRLGMIEDGSNRARLTKLLRYKSSKSEDKYVSLEDYVERMPESQKAIYFIAAESMEKIKQSPVLNDAIQRDVEVLYMIDAIDEYVVSHVTDFASKKLVNLAKEDPDFETDKDRKKYDKYIKKKYDKLTKWFKDLLGPEKATRVILTKRKTPEAMILSTPTHGVSANMARIMRGQALGDKNQESDAKRTVELNRLHPLVDEVFKRVQADEKDDTAGDIAMVLYDVAALQNGFDVKDTLALSKRMNKLLRASVDIPADAALLDENLSEFDAEIAADGTEEAESSGDDSDSETPEESEKEATSEEEN